jgi:hypothetical protein
LKEIKGNLGEDGGSLSRKKKHQVKCPKLKEPNIFENEVDYCAGRMKY